MCDTPVSIFMSSQQYIEKENYHDSITLFLKPDRLLRAEWVGSLMSPNITVANTCSLRVYLCIYFLSSVIHSRPLNRLDEGRAGSHGARRSPPKTAPLPAAAWAWRGYLGRGVFWTRGPMAPPPQMAPSRPRPLPPPPAPPSKTTGGPPSSLPMPR